MKNREMLMKLKQTEPMRSHIKKLLHEIISHTYESGIYDVKDFTVLDKDVEVCYEYSYCGEWSTDGVQIPLEWLDEGFDYQTAYLDMLEKARRAALRAEAAVKRRREEAKKKAADKKAKKEYETYLKLKQKYDGEKVKKEKKREN